MSRSKPAKGEVVRERYFVAVVPTILDVLILSTEQREMYLGYWAEAKAQRYGLRIEVIPDDTDLLIHGLLQARAEHGGFGDLVLFSTSTPGVVFLTHKTKRLS